ncbi:hypothetical protein HG530_002891 [Fusarium avenaceum]|nr:hypothetical protein HG530_002891 [Fusarium avenaceum]
MVLFPAAQGAAFSTPRVRPLANQIKKLSTFQLTSCLGTGHATTSYNNSLGLADLVLDLMKLRLGLFGRANALPHQTIPRSRASSDDKGVVADLSNSSGVVHLDTDNIGVCIKSHGLALDPLKLIGGIGAEDRLEGNQDLVVGDLAGNNNTGHGDGPVEMGIGSNNDHLEVVALENMVDHCLANDRQSGWACAEDYYGLGVGHCDFWGMYVPIPYLLQTRY